MKFKKMIAIALSMVTVTGALSSCGSNNEPGDGAGTTDPAGTTGTVDSTKLSPELLAEYGLDENLKFTETRKITVEVYDRGNDNGTDPTNNPYTDYIKNGMLEKHNVEVEFVAVPRWTEVEELNNLLASGTAPDICVTYSYPTIQTYGNMGGVTDISPYVQNQELLPNLWDLLGETNIYWDEDPTTGRIWAIEAYLKHNNKINTFVRKDWLEKLGREEPTTAAEFEEMLVAFRDNADTLLGADADKMVPFSMSYDIGWRANNIIASKTPNEYPIRDRFIQGFDDRMFLFDGTKEGVRLLNKWYNDGLIWKDFALYGSGDKTEDNYLKAGYVGAFQHNWHYPYQNGEDSIDANLKRLSSEGAEYVAIDPFENEAGEYRKYLAGPIDRKVFFPTTNDEPIASLLYLDWLSTLENRMFLQIGTEGINHTVNADGSISMINATDENIMNSNQNLDYTIVINGLDLGDDEKTLNSIASSYPGVNPETVKDAYETSLVDKVVGENVNVGEIAAETGMGPALGEKRDVVLVNAVVAKPEDFDKVWDTGMSEYLGAGGQAIIDERADKWKEFYGDSETKTK